MNCSGYPYMPCSEMSRPAFSWAGVTRRPYVRLVTQNTASELENTKAATTTIPIACDPSWVSEPV